MKYGLTSLLMTMATTCNAATIATISGPDLRWGGPVIIDGSQHDYSMTTTFSPDFGAATATYSAPSSGYPDQTWQLTTSGMTEATRMFFHTADGRSVVTLNGDGSDWGTLSDVTFPTIVQTMQVEYWPADVNESNLVSKLTAEAVPVVSVVPEPSALVLGVLGFVLTCWRRRVYS